MDSKEIREALLNGTAVIHNGIKYKCVTAVILRRIKNELITQAELLDMNENSRSIADIKRVERIEE